MITMMKIPKIPNVKIKGGQVYGRLLKGAKPYWFMFLAGIVGTFLASGADAGLSWLVKPIIDRGLVAGEKLVVFWMPLIVIVIFIFRGFSLFLSHYCLTRVGRSVVMDFRQKLFAHYLRLPASFYDKESSGQMLSLIVYNAEQLAASITYSSITILQEGTQLIGLIVVMLIISWKLSLLFLITMPPLSYVINYATKRLRALSHKVQSTVGDITHIAEEGIQGYKIVRTFGGEEYESDKFNKAAYLNRHCELKVAITDAICGSIVQILASLPLALILYLVTRPSLHVSIGGFGAMIAAIIRLFTPIRRLTKVNIDIQKGIAAANGIFNVLDQPEELDTGMLTLERASGHIEYRDVKFRYPTAQDDVLHGISFTVSPGQTVALVGRSGSGKSTMVSLLPRFYDVNSGTISIDGTNINEYKLKDLRRQFALVSQEVILFNDTIGRNIAYGCFEKATQEEIIKAAEAAHLMDFIKTLPQGFDTMIGENGLLLSGGQRQRIAIARAILKNAPILILDEATSSLDTETEHHIQMALDNLIHRQTTLVIAHRLSTVENADKILVIEGGRMVESGTHKELLARGAQYTKFYEMQFKKTSHQN